MLILNLYRKGDESHRKIPIQGILKHVTIAYLVPIILRQNSAKDFCMTRFRSNPINSLGRFSMVFEHGCQISFFSMHHFLVPCYVFVIQPEKKMEASFWGSYRADECINEILCLHSVARVAATAIPL